MTLLYGTLQRQWVLWSMSADVQQVQTVCTQMGTTYGYGPHISVCHSNNNNNNKNK